VIALFLGVCGTYLLINKWWMLTIALLGIAGVLLCVGTAAVISLNQNKVNEVPTALIEEKMPRLIPQWDYRPRKAIRGYRVLDSPSKETSDGLSSDPFGINDNVWLNDNSLEGAAPPFINGSPETDEPITKAPANR
jgi:hypothetical protein